jgi:hypothetical protein
MLRHIIALSILLMSLLAAGVPVNDRRRQDSSRTEIS